MTHVYLVEHYDGPINNHDHTQTADFRCKSFKILKCKSANSIVKRGRFCKKFYGKENENIQRIPSRTSFIP